MGAWDVYYKKGTHGGATSPVGYGCIAVKAELTFNGASGLSVDPVIGISASEAIVAFQKATAGLAVDGVVGEFTAQALFRKRFAKLESKYAIPAGILCRQVGLESDYDPGAVGVRDPNDHGICQIDALQHPDITLTQAFTPSFAINYMAETLHTAFRNMEDWDCAIASWNVGGGGAEVWCSAGKPATLIFGKNPDGTPYDLGAQATEYVALVRARSC